MHANQSIACFLLHIKEGAIVYELCLDKKSSFEAEITEGWELGNLESHEQG